MSYSASRTMTCTKSPAEGRMSPFLLSRGTCLYPVSEHKVAAVNDQKKENMKSSLCRGWIEFSMLCQRRENSHLCSFMKCWTKSCQWLLHNWVTVRQQPLQTCPTYPSLSCWMEACTVQQTHYQTWSHGLQWGSAPLLGLAHTHQTGSFRSMTG